MSFITQRRVATLFIAPLFAGLITACQEQPKEPEALSLDTPEKRLSYGIALRMGERMKSDGMTLDVDAYATGMRDAFDGAEAKLTDEEINAEMMAFQERCRQSSKRHKKPLLLPTSKKVLLSWLKMPCAMELR